MDWNTALLIGFIVLMLICCGSMAWMMRPGKQQDDKQDKE